MLVFLLNRASKFNQRQKEMNPEKLYAGIHSCILGFHSNYKSLIAFVAYSSPHFRRFLRIPVPGETGEMNPRGESLFEVVVRPQESNIIPPAKISNGNPEAIGRQHSEH